MACNHKCGCGKVFHTPRGLKNHITRAHAGHPDRSKRVSAVDLARVTAERDAAVSGQNEAMALVIGLEGTVGRLT